MEIELKMTEELRELVCESEHPIKVILNSNYAKITHETPEEIQNLVHKPFSLIIKTVPTNLPRYLIEESKELKKFEKVVLCSFFPKIEEEYVEESSGEFVFLSIYIFL